MKTEEIIPNQKFLDGREVYEKGKKYRVPPERAAYFRALGWVGEPGEALEQEASLDIQDGKVGHKSK